MHFSIFYRGEIIMETMHISLSAFQISGGLILFLFSLTMIFGEGKPKTFNLVGSLNNVHRGL